MDRPIDRPGRAVLPRRVCILRLSALGDCANVVPVVHTLQAARPDIEIGWVINRGEAALIDDLPGVDAIAFDKRGGVAAYRALGRRLAARRYDVLLNMHASWRANLVGRLVRAGRRVGFDARRAHDGQRLFVDERIAPVAARHVVDGFLAFAAHIGAGAPVYDWRVPVGAPARARAARLLGDDRREILFISACSSHARRNWPAARYAALADYAARRHGLRCVLVGSTGSAERRAAGAIVAAARAPIVDLVGATSIKDLLALLARGRVLVCPDSGPAHLSNASGIATIALHAATDPRRSAPYRSRALCADYFAAAARAYRAATPDQLQWGSRIEDDEHVMALIPVAAVCERLDAVMAGTHPMWTPA